MFRSFALALALARKAVLSMSSSNERLRQCVRRCQMDEAARLAGKKQKPVTGRRARTGERYEYKGRMYSVYRSKTGRRYINVTDPRTKKRKRKSVPKAK